MYQRQGFTHGYLLWRLRRTLFDLCINESQEPPAPLVVLIEFTL